MTNEEKQFYSEYLRKEIRFLVTERLPIEKRYLSWAKKSKSQRMIELALHNIEAANLSLACLKQELEEL